MKFTKAKRKINLKKNGLLQKIPNTNNFLVLSEFFWLVDYDNEFSEKIIVPKNFITDFGSIPQIFWTLYNPTRYVAYILHDFLYSKKYVGEISRRKADLILNEALKVEGMWKIKRLPVYLSVRLFGRKFYKKN